MNRIPMLSSPSDTAWDSLPASEAQTASALYVPVRGEQALSLFAPVHYEANYAYPLLVWLHGNAQDEDQLKQIMPAVSLRNYVGLGVRGTEATPGPARPRHFRWSQSRAHVALAEQAVFSALDVAMDRYHVAPSRVFIAGFETGGTMALRLALAHPGRFAGVLSIDGELPTERAPLGRLADARRLPVFLACGRDSDAYPTSTVCGNLRLLHSAGMVITLRQYPCGNELADMMLGDMDRWMMEQITGQPAAVA